MNNMNNMNKKVLFAGCSFTHKCGFSPANQLLYHWPHLLESHFKFDSKNIALGGASNSEIFYRTVEQLSINKYDVAVVQWSNISRLWVYNSQNNIDDFTILNNGRIKGFIVDRSATQQFADLYYKHFFNTMVSVKRWLLDIIALESLLSRTNTKHIFVKGFDNCLTLFSDFKKSGAKEISDGLKLFVDFDNRPDDYMLQKINEIWLLMDVVSKFNWINFDSDSFSNFPIEKDDVACDGIHPGKKSNQKLADQITPIFDDYFK